MSRWCIVVAAALLALGQPARAQLAPGLHVLESVPKSSFGLESEAWGISGDGRVVVGRAFTDDGWLPARWVDGAVELLPTIPRSQSIPRTFPVAQAASGDGATIVGITGSDAYGYQGFELDGEEFTALGDTPQGNFRVWDALAVSSDGRRVVGFGTPLDRQANVALLIDDGDARQIAPAPGSSWSSAIGISPDGRTIVGFALFELGSPTHGFVHHDGVLRALPGPQGSFAVARAVANGGWRIAGYALTDVGREIVLWEEGALRRLGIRTRPNLAAPPLALSANGHVLVGGSEEHGAFVWDALHGVRDLEDYVVDDLGFELGRWRLNQAMGISNDGRTIAGLGHHSGTTGFVLRLPPACSDALDNDGDGLADGDDESCVDGEGISESFRSDLIVDVYPGRDDNVVSLTSRAQVAVAVSGSETARVVDIDLLSLRLGPGAAAPTQPPPPAFRDLNRDGIDDLLLRFEARELGLAFGDTELCLSGQIDGVPFRGCDTIRVVVRGCGFGWEIAFPLLWLRARRRGRGGS